MTNPNSLPPTGAADDMSRIDSKRGSLSRRALFAGGAGAVGATLSSRAALAKDATPSDGADGIQEVHPFHGRHQSGIVTSQPASALYVAFDVLTADRAELSQLFRILTERLAFLTQGGSVVQSDPLLPPQDSGILGPKVFTDNLTATVSVGASLFDYRFGLMRVRPRRLGVMERFRNDALDPDQCHGDLLLQLCANTIETNIHALRDVIRHVGGLAAVRWKVEGFLPPHVVKKLGTDTVRNMLGFKDGTANLDARNRDLMDQYVWVSPQAREPAWTIGGSYQVVRIIRFMVERWDRIPLREQEQIFGRHKTNGAPLGTSDEHDAPDYEADPQGGRISLAAHIRRANPRTPGSEANLLLRRSYNYSRGLTKAGQLDMGLVFVCYQADLTAGFLTVQSRLNGEQLEDFIKPSGGGYFFALPGVEQPGDMLGQSLLAAR